MSDRYPGVYGSVFWPRPSLESLSLPVRCLMIPLSQRHKGLVDEEGNGRLEAEVGTGDELRGALSFYGFLPFLRVL